MSTKHAKASEEVTIVEVNKGLITFNLIGTTPLILHRMSEKAKNELLLPKGRKTAAEKAASMKHNPYEEFRDSAYTSIDPKSKTFLLFLTSAFKGAISEAAKDLPGVNKTKIGRLTHVEGSYVDIYGIPKLLMTVVRSADMNKTPDIRTRMILPQWCCRVTISFVQPLIREQAVANLLGAAGVTVGIGDWRPEKGAGNYGQFMPISSNEQKDFDEIVKTGGRAAQLKAIENPVCFDKETEDLLSWFDIEVKRRGFTVIK